MEDFVRCLQKNKESFFPPYAIVSTTRSNMHQDTKELKNKLPTTYNCQKLLRVVTELVTWKALYDRTVIRSFTNEAEFQTEIKGNERRFVIQKTKTFKYPQAWYTERIAEHIMVYEFEEEQLLCSFVLSGTGHPILYITEDTTVTGMQASKQGIQHGTHREKLQIVEYSNEYAEYLKEEYTKYAQQRPIVIEHFKQQLREETRKLAPDNKSRVPLAGPKQHERERHSRSERIR